MMTAFKGGRGQTAPYETTHLRVPIELKPHFEKIMQEYKRKIAERPDQTRPDLQEVYESLGHTYLSADEALEIAKGVVRSKKSAKISLSKLLTGLYGNNERFKSL